MTDALRVDVCQGAEELIDVELDFEDGHDSLHLVEISGGAVHGFGDVFEDEVQVDFVFLWMDDGLAKRFVKRTKLTLSPLL